MKNTNREFIIGYDIAGPEGLDCAVVSEKLPDGTLRIVDVRYRTTKKVEQALRHSPCPLCDSKAEVHNGMICALKYSLRGAKKKDTI